MIVTNKKRFDSKFCVRINDSDLEKCEQYKYLGVIFDKNLNWKHHIEYVSTKISKACGSLSKLRHCLSVKVLVEIYNALIHSYVRYGIITWGNAPDSTLNPLQTLLNRAVRILTFAPFGHVDLKPIFKELYILDVKNTFFLESSKYMFKRKNGLLPARLADYFDTTNSQSQSITSYNLRSSVRQNRVVTRLLSSNRSIQVRGENLWDEIPQEVKLNSSINSFKRLIKRMLIESY